jgi:hypothetical protein
VNCDCEVRPLRQWLDSQVSPGPEWDMLQCAAPKFLEGQSIAVIPEDRMTCGAERDSPRFQINPDLKFRDIHRWVEQLNMKV